MSGNNPIHNNDTADRLSVDDNPKALNQLIISLKTQLISAVKTRLLAGNGVISTSTPVNTAGQQTDRTSTVSDEPNQKGEITMENLMEQRIPITLNQLVQLLLKNSKKVLVPSTLANSEEFKIDDLAQHIVEDIEQAISQTSQKGITIICRDSDEKHFAGSGDKDISANSNGQIQLRSNKDSGNDLFIDENSQKILSGSGGKQVTRGIPTPTTGIVDLIYDNEAKDNRSPHLFSKKTNPYSLGLASPRSDETKLRFFPPNPSDNNLGKNNGVGSPGSGRVEKPAIEELLKIESIKIVELNSKFKIICDLNGRLIKARHRCKMAKIDKTSFLAIIEDGIRLHLGRIWDTCNELSQQNSPPQQGQQGILSLDNINTFLLEIEGQLSGNAPSPKI